MIDDDVSSIRESAMLGLINFADTLEGSDSILAS